MQTSIGGATMINDAMFSSNTNEWATPQAFFDELNKEFDFTLDPCATPQNANAPTTLQRKLTDSRKVGAAKLSFVIRRTVGIFQSGSQRLMPKPYREGQNLLFCLYPPERIRRTSTTTYIKSTKYVSSADACTLTKANAARRFRQWLS